MLRNGICFGNPIHDCRPICNAVIYSMNYRFNKERHLHQLEVDGEWKNLTGCTTVLGILNKPALVPWASKMATEYVREYWKPDVGYEESYIDKVLYEAKNAHAKRKEKAGDFGTHTHEVIQEIANDVIANSGGEILSGKNAEPAIQNFLDWAMKNKVKILETEKNVYSENLWVGGICDAVVEIDGKRWVMDIKTAKSGIYPENFWQTGCYDLLLQEMGQPKADGYIILNLKEDGEMVEKRSVSVEDNQQAFLSCLNIYRILEKTKSNIN